eukprot:COSAG01_NODE_26498_length_712_cov_0.964111_1_plen_145_part_00
MGVVVAWVGCAQVVRLAVVVATQRGQRLSSVRGHVRGRLHGWGHAVSGHGVTDIKMSGNVGENQSLMIINSLICVVTASSTQQLPGWAAQARIDACAFRSHEACARDTSTDCAPYLRPPSQHPATTVAHLGRSAGRDGGRPQLL